MPRIGFQGFCLNDAGNGVRGTDGVNAYASGVHVGASWNKNLTYARGLYMGAEFKAKGGKNRSQYRDATSKLTTPPLSSCCFRSSCRSFGASC